jgi:hypothetical protein
MNGADLVRDLLDLAVLLPALETLTQDFGDQPSLATELKQVLAIVYFAISLPDKAQSIQREVLAARRAACELDSTCLTDRALAVALSWSGRIDDGASKSLSAPDREALEDMRESVAIFDRNPQPPDMQALLARQILADAYAKRNDWGTCADINRHVVHEARSILDANSKLGTTARIRVAAEQRLQTATLSLAEALRIDGKPDEALRELDPLWKTIESDGNVDVRIRIKTLNNRGLARIDAAKMPHEQSYDASRADPGLQDLVDTLALASEQLGADQVETIDAGVNLASQLWRVRGKRAAEETLALRPLLEASKSLGPSATRSRAALAIALARAYRSVGDESNANQCIAEARQDVPGDGAPEWTTELLREIANFHEMWDDLSEAIAVRQRLTQQARPRGSDPAGTRKFVDASSDLAYACLWSGSPRQAVEVLREALRFADRAESEGGLALASDARWNATNLLALALQRSGERNLEQIEGRIAQLRAARERHNATATSKSGAKAKRVTWNERPDPRSQGN